MYGKRSSVISIQALYDYKYDAGGGCRPGCVISIQALYDYKSDVRQQKNISFVISIQALYDYKCLFGWTALSWT